MNKNFHLDNKYFFTTYSNCQSKTNHKQTEVMCNLKSELQSSLKEMLLTNIYFPNREKKPLKEVNSSLKVSIFLSRKFIQCCFLSAATSTAQSTDMTVMLASKI